MSSESPAPLYVPDADGRIVNLHAVIEVEADTDDAGNPTGAIVLIMPAPGFEPGAPHIVVLNGEIGQLAMNYFRHRAEAGITFLRHLAQS